jgi:DNA repair protein RadD
LGLYIQMAGRSLRCVGGRIETSIAAGKADAAVLDFSGNIDRHGPLDFITIKETKSRLVSCEACSTRNAAAARKCWSCDAPMTKLCPACLGEMVKGCLDCPHCAFDMRQGPRADAEAPKLAEVPSGAALIRSWGVAKERQGGWVPATRVWNDGHIDLEGKRVMLPESLAAAVRGVAPRWIRFEDDGAVAAVLVPNGSSRITARQITAAGLEMIVPLPAVAA